MMVRPPAGWRLHHLTDRSIELRKDDYAYRRYLGRDGFVRVRAEPGMDRNGLIDKAMRAAMRDDADLADRMAREIVPRRIGGYQMRQREFATAFGTPEDPEPTDVASTLTQLPAVGETDYAEVAAKLSGVPTFSGTVIAQRFQNLEPGRVYRWAVEFGASDNRRGPTLLVGCVEGA